MALATGLSWYAVRAYPPAGFMLRLLAFILPPGLDSVAVAAG
jgi:hypothetical protein